MSARTLEDVLAAHVRGDWSDRTYSCLGCRKRFEEETQEAWEAMTSDDERKAYRAELGRYMKPDWTLDDYVAHVAAEVRAWLAEADSHCPRCNPATCICTCHDGEAT